MLETSGVAIIGLPRRAIVATRGTSISVMVTRTPTLRPIPTGFALYVWLRALLGVLLTERLMMGFG